MTDKTVRVRLQADHAQYVKAMGESGKATESLNKRADGLQETGRKTAALGDSLTTKLTLPIVGVGVAATKMALDVDAVFTDMQALAGATAEEVESMRGEVLELAGETGKAPKELADALYFLKSSGLDAESAMEALTVSAKASAAGMGSTVDIADAVSSAMNAYAKSGLSAAEATDVLVATAREGKAEPAELAAQMGRLLPISSELGITFQDVGAGLAALSLSGNDAASASTLLSNIMSKLLKPSQQAMELMQGVGIGLDDIRKMIAEKGLLGTLETLRASLGDAGFTRFLEDAQAVQGGLALTGENVEKNREIFDSLNDSVGATEKAFETWGKSAGAANAKAWGELQAQLVKLGDALIPLTVDVVQFGSAMLDWLVNLPGPAQKALLVFAGLLAVMGPFLSVFGRIQQLVSGGMRLGTAFLNWASGMNAFGQAMNNSTSAASGMTSSLGRMKGAAGLAGIAVAVAGIGFAMNEHFKQKNREAIAGLAESFADLGDEIDEAARKEVESLVAWDQADEVFNKLVDTNRAAAERFLDVAEASGMQADAVEKARDRLDQKAESEKNAAEDAEKNAKVTEDAAEAYDSEADAITRTVTALGEYARELQAQFDPLFGLVDALQGNKAAQDAVIEAQGKLNEAVKQHGRNSAEATVAQEALDAAMLDVGKSAVGVMSATAGLNAAIADNPELLGQSKGMLEEWQAAGLLTQEQASFLARQFDATALRAQALGKADPTIEVRTTGLSTADGQLDALRRKYDNATWKVKINIAVDKGGINIGGGVKVRALGGPVYRGEGYIVGEKGPEWFEPEQSGRIIPNSMLGRSVAQSSLSGGGGPVTNLFMDFSGVMTTSPRQFQGMVADALNTALRTMPGRVNIVSSAVRR